MEPGKGPEVSALSTPPVSQQLRTDKLYQTVSTLFVFNLESISTCGPVGELQLRTNFCPELCLVDSHNEQWDISVLVYVFYIILKKVSFWSLLGILNRIIKCYSGLVIEYQHSIILVSDFFSRFQPINKVDNF